jgi:radical SAM superfamily enzyme YgiQ (UPF0313 family)
MRVVVLGTYEMGRQPFGLASAAAWLEEAGFEARCVDLSRQRLSDVFFDDVGLIALSLPMHTATRLALELLPRLAERAPKAHLVAFGLYAPLNREHLEERGVHTVLGPEAEPDLLALAEALRAKRAPPSFSTTLRRLPLKVPSRSTLPTLEDYAHLTLPSGSSRVVGYVEATRGCKHSCRHCPVVPVYQGRFFAVPAEVVLEDIARQVAAGAEHITFGDPDFFNGPTHALRIVRALHERHPSVTYDAIIKVEHLLAQREALAELVATGCAFVTTAVESLDDTSLALLDKGHTRADFEEAVVVCRAAGLALSPTFLPFTPWLSLAGYKELLEGLAALRLVEAVAPVQLSIRLLLPRGSLLLERDELRPYVQAFDPAELAYPWTHEDPRVDALQRQVSALVEGAGPEPHRRALFRQIWELGSEHAGGWGPCPVDEDHAAPRCTVPFLNEPWYC